MSAQRHGGDGKLSEQQGQVEMEPTGSSSWRRQDSNDIVSQSHQTLKKKSKVVNATSSEENDEDLFTVPDVEARPALNSSINNNVQGGNNQDSDNLQLGISGKRRRGRNPVDKEYKRLKRLLRNRVSAQQARERKKVYVNELEARARELQDQNSKLEEKISTLTNENMMLRKILMNTRPKVDESIDQKKQQQ